MTRADDARPRDRQFALRLGLAAHAVGPDTGAADASLVETLGAPHPLATTATDHTRKITALAFASSGHLLASGSEDGVVELWDVGDPARPVPSDRRSTGPGRAITALALSSDGTLLAAGTDQGVWLWDGTSASGHPVSSTGPVRSLALSPHQPILAVAAAGGLELWDVSQPTRPRPWTAGTGALDGAGTAISVAFSREGVLAYGAGDKAVHLWDLQGHRPFGPPLPDHGSAPTLAFSDDGHMLATGAADGLRLWDLTTPGAPRLAGGPRGGALAVTAVAPDQRTVVGRSAPGDPLLIDVTDPHQPQVVEAGITTAPGEATAVALAPDGHTVAAGRVDGKLQTWETDDPRRPRPRGAGTPGSSGPGRLVAFADGDTLVVSSSDGVAMWNVHDPDDPHEVGRPAGGTGSYVGAVGFSRARHTVALVGSGDAPQVQVWDVGDETTPHPVGPPLDGASGLAALSPDGRTVAVDGEFGVELRELADRDRSGPAGLVPGSGVYGRATALAFSPDSRLLVVTYLSDGAARISLWDVADPGRPRPLGVAVAMEANAAIEAVAVSPDRRLLAVSAVLPGGSASVSLWDIADPEQPHQLGSRLSTGFRTALTSLAFSPDSRILAVGSVGSDGFHDLTDGSVWLWDVTSPASPRRLGVPLTGNAGRVTSLGFSPDGRMLAVGSAGRDAGPSVVARLWDLGGLLDLRRHAVPRACDEAGSLSEREWDLLAPGVPFADPCPPAEPTAGES